MENENASSQLHFEALPLKEAVVPGGKENGEAYIV